MPKKPADEVSIPRSLEEIHSDLGKARHRIDEAVRTFDRGTLADRVWIGVCCLAAKEHHALPVNQRGQGRKKKSLPRRGTDSEPTAEIVHPQGFLSWLKVAIPWLGQSAAYNYMDGAKGCGLTAWSTEKETRKVVADLLQRFDDLSMKQLADQGKTAEPEEKPKPPKTDPRVLATQAVEQHEAECENLVALRQHFSPKQHSAVVNRFAGVLKTLTGQEWGPVA